MNVLDLAAVLAGRAALPAAAPGDAPAAEPGDAFARMLAGETVDPETSPDGTEVAALPIPQPPQVPTVDPGLLAAVMPAPMPAPVPAVVPDVAAAPETEVDVGFAVDKSATGAGSLVPAAVATLVAPRTRVAGPEVAPEGTLAEPAVAETAARTGAGKDQLRMAAEPGAATPDLKMHAGAPAGAKPEPELSLRAAAAPGWQLAPEQAAPLHRVEAAHTTSAAVTPHAVAHQIAVAIGKATDRKVEIRLDPPELGRVQIQLTATDGGGVQAVVMAQRPETQDLLRRHPEVLAQELAAAGYESVDLSFAGGSETPARRDEAPGSWAEIAPPEVAPGAGPAPIARPAPRRTDAALDIRL